MTYTEQAIVLVFRHALCSNISKKIYRGSEDTAQIVEEVIYEIFKNKTHFVGGGNVATYFYQAFLDIWNAGMRDDFLTAKNSNPGYDLWVDTKIHVLKQKKKKI